jgi:CheY-like chemotaxis protein
LINCWRSFEVSDLTHDILNRLAAAKMNAELLARNANLPETLRKNVDRILVNITQVQDMVTGTPYSESQAKSASNNRVSTTNTTASELGAAAPARPKTILLIDDSEDLRILFKTILKPRGYSVTVAKDESEAVAILKTGELPALVLLDYSLGDKTGSDVLDTLEKQGSKVFTESKIVLFTAHGKLVQDPRAYAVEQKSMDIASMIKLVEKYC